AIAPERREVAVRGPMVVGVFAGEVFGHVLGRRAIKRSPHASAAICLPYIAMTPCADSGTSALRTGSSKEACDCQRSHEDPCQPRMSSRAHAWPIVAEAMRCYARRGFDNIRSNQLR